MPRRTVSFSRDAANIFFHILTRCNLTCRHCYINPDHHGTRTLSSETIMDWLTVFSDNSPRANLIFLGGEPTLHPDLPEVVHAARRLRFDSVTVDTNGFLFHDFLDRVCPDDLDFLSFSLDGATPESNDAIRGPGCFQAVVSGLRRARKIGISCSVIFTVSAQNLQDIFRMPDLLASLDIQRFFIQVIGVRGNSRELSDTLSDTLQVTRTAWESAIPDVAQRIARSGITVTYPKVFLRDDEPFLCAGRVADNYFVFPNGRVYRCPVCEDFPLHSMMMGEHSMISRPSITESDLFNLDIPEGCVMNRLVQPGNLSYLSDGRPAYRIACCMLKEEISP